MLRWLLASSLQFRFLVLALATALIVFGAARLQKMPLDALPEFSLPSVEVQTEALGLAPTEVEALITVPIEELLNGVPWIRSMRSESVTGLSSIVLFFEPGTNLIRARQMVQERLTQAQGLPSRKVAKAPVMLQPRSATNRVMMVGLSSNTLSPIELSVLARWDVKPRLLGVPGVANVAVWGQRERQLQVQVDPARLHGQGVTLDQVIATTGNAMWVSPLSFLQASTPGSGGFVDGQNQRLGITHRQPITTARDLAQVTVEGSKLPLGSVANVVENHQPLIGDAVVGGAPGLLLVIEKLPGASTPDVTRRVEAALEALRPGLPGVTVNTRLFQPASFLASGAENLRGAGLMGALLALIALLALLRDWRSALIGVLSSAVALCAALVTLYLSGVTFNVVLLAGLVLALGVLVDDAVRDSDAFARRLHEPQPGDAEKSRLSIALASATRTRGSMFSATLIAALAVLPLYALNGFSGALFQPLAGAYLLALGASFLVALTLTPALCLLLSRPVQTQTAPTEPQGVSTSFDRLIAPALARPGLSLLAVGVLVGAGLLAWTQLRRGPLLPPFKENDLVLSWNGAPGASREAMVRTATEVSRELKGIPGVLNVSAHVGRAVTGDQVVGINSGKLWVNLDPTADHAALRSTVREKLRAHPEFAPVQSYLQQVTDNAVVGASNALVVRVYGQEMDVLAQKAQEVESVLENVSGLVSPRIVRQSEQPILEVKVNLKAAQQVGLKPGDVRRAATTLVNGIEVGNLFEAQKVFDVLVVGTPATRANAAAIGKLLIDTPIGGQVPLAQVAEVRSVPTPSVVRRQGNSRWMDVEATVQGRDFGAVALDVRARLADIRFPQEYHPELLGEVVQTQAARQWLIGLGLAALALVYLLLQAAFRSWRLALVGLAALLATLSGGVLAAVLTGTPTSLGLIGGLIALVGLAVRGQIAFVHRSRQLEGTGLAFGPELVRRAARDSFTPLLAASVATVLALLPVLWTGNGAGMELLRPITVVLIGGLLVSLATSGLVLPALYLWLREQPEPEFDFNLPEFMPPISLPPVRSADATD